MENQLIPFYIEIEISECSDQEDTYFLANKKSTAAPQTQKSKKPKLNRGKKNEIYIKCNHSIRSKMKTLDLPVVLTELNKMTSEFKKNAKFNEGKGTPLSILQVAEYLNEQIVLGKTEIDAKKKKSMSKELNQIKKAISALYSEVKDEIEETKKLIDFEKLEEMEDTENIDDESIEGSTAADSKPAISGQKAEVKEQKRAVEEEEEVDFSKRLTMSKEDRRKFWLAKKVVHKVEDRKQPRTTRGKPNPAASQQKKQFQNEQMLAESFSLNIEDLKAFAKEVNYQKSSLDIEGLQTYLQKLTYGVENTTDLSMKTGLLILIVYLQIELAREQIMPDIELIESCLENIKQLLELIKEDEIKIQNYSHEEENFYSKQDLVRQFNGFVNMFGEEIEFSIKMTHPFDKELHSRLTQETDYISFLFTYLEFLSLNTEELYVNYSNEVRTKILQIIHYISDDFVLSCQALSEIFENDSISQTVRQFAEIICKSNSSQKTIAKVKLFCAFNLAINLQNLQQADSLITETLSLNVSLSSDKYLSALFNRTLTQMGITSFKQNNPEKCKFYLFELLNTDNTEELLFQYSIEKENAIDLQDPMSIFPYHMHINLEEAKAAFLLSSVLTESSKTILYQDNLSACSANKVFTRFLDSHQMTLFINSPANIFDRIFSFYRKIIQYDNTAALKQVDSIKYFHTNDDFKEFIMEFVTQECLNCYLEKLKGDNKSTFLIQEMANLFSIKKEKLIETLNRKIQTGDLQAKIDEKEGVILINNALNNIIKSEKEYNIIESLRMFSELNEKINSMKEEIGKKGNKTLDITNFIAKKFEVPEKFFNFTYDFAFFKRQVG